MSKSYACRNDVIYNELRYSIPNVQKVQQWKRQGVSFLSILDVFFLSLASSDNSRKNSERRKYAVDSFIYGIEHFTKKRNDFLWKKKRI